MFYEDIFEIREIDPMGKKFDRVSRIICQCDNDNTEITLDLNYEIYPLYIGNKINIALATTLNLDGQQMDDSFDPSLLDGKKQTLMDSYEYVMNGRVFRQQASKDSNTVEIYASFGGLLMCIKGDPRSLSFPTGADPKIFLLVKKVNE